MGLAGAILTNLRRAAGYVSPALVAKYDRLFWGWFWRDPSRKAPWKGREAPQEVVEAVESGWLPPTGDVLDVGCGEGMVAAWFAGRGYRATGIDISEAAINQAAQRYQADGLDFLAHDITTGVLPGRSFSAFLDRGCLHVIHPRLALRYADHVTAMATPDARMIILMKAFRGASGDADQEARHHEEMVRRLFEPRWKVERVTRSKMGRAGASNESKMTGLAFYLVRAA